MPSENGLDFMAFRFWIGMWVTLLIMIIVAFDLSSLVRYITRFTEECFACLISIIFIVEAILKLLEIEQEYGVNKHPGDPEYTVCQCVRRNTTDEETGRNGSSSWLMDTMKSEAPQNVSHMSHVELREHCEVLGDQFELEGKGCHYVPDVFLLSVLLGLGTFVIAYGLKMFKTSPFFPSKVY